MFDIFDIQVRRIQESGRLLTLRLFLLLLGGWSLLDASLSGDW